MLGEGFGGEKGGGGEGQGEELVDVRSVSEVRESAGSQFECTYARGRYEGPTSPSRVTRDSATAATRPSAPSSAHSNDAAREAQRTVFLVPYVFDERDPGIGEVARSFSSGGGRADASSFGGGVKPGRYFNACRGRGIGRAGVRRGCHPRAPRGGRGDGKRDAKAKISEFAYALCTRQRGDTVLLQVIWKL